MAYRKTEKVLEGMRERGDAIVAATVDLIAKSGVEAVTTDAVALRAKVSVGLIYKYFPDKTAILLKAIAYLREHDVAAMRDAAEGLKPQQALVAAVAVYYSRLTNPRLIRARANSPVYQLKMRDEFAALIGAASGEPVKGCELAAIGALGALFALADVAGAGKKNAPEAVLFVLRGVGFQEAWARREVEKRYSLAG